MRFLYWKASTRSPASRGFTLIEVIASLVLVGSLMVGVLMAHRGCARQTKLAVQRLAAIKVLDESMTRWTGTEADGSTELDSVSGKAPGQNKFYWRKLVSGQVSDDLLGFTILRIEVFDPDFESGDTLASVEVVAPASESLGVNR